MESPVEDFDFVASVRSILQLIHEPILELRHRFNGKWVVVTLLPRQSPDFLVLVEGQENAVLARFRSVTMFSDTEQILKLVVVLKCFDVQHNIFNFKWLNNRKPLTFSVSGSGD
jgi:hypothetical protein